jgi:hypothetical protein
VKLGLVVASSSGRALSIDMVAKYSNLW